MLGGVFEFVTVDAQGRVLDPRLTAAGAARLFGGPVPGLPTEMVPDEPMGWTATALLAVKRDRAARARGGADGAPSDSPGRSSTPGRRARRSATAAQPTAAQPTAARPVPHPPGSPT